MIKTIKKINEEQLELTEEHIVAVNKADLVKERDRLTNALTEINNMLKEFDK